ncbi:MAG: DUF4845 domain-containing protein [Nitrosomonas sp.]|nr:DUF4845 domain-containing protein [Nitrosomonas sp.]MCW5606651.1 DUF4845 domain-containing protein [Nitrosomonas sp.]
MYWNISRYKQRGLTLTGMLFGSMILVLITVMGMKIIPVYIDNATIKKNLVAVASDSNLQNANASQIRFAFAKRAQVDGINAISAKDLKIVKDRDKLILSVAYTIEVPMISNISLKFDFDVTSD